VTHDTGWQSTVAQLVYCADPDGNLHNAACPSQHEPTVRVVCVLQVLFRKGGIREPTFQPKAKRFLLFPTAFHSDAQLLKPGVAEQFHQVSAAPSAPHSLWGALVHASKISTCGLCVLRADVCSICVQFVRMPCLFQRTTSAWLRQRNINQASV
jgi:hypothetical protein